MDPSQLSQEESGSAVSGAGAEKPYIAEYAPSARAACRKCKGKIAKEALRIGKVLKSTKFDGNMTLWFHLKCLLTKPGILKSLGDVAGVDLLRWEDQQALRGYLREGPSALGATGPADGAGATSGATNGGGGGGSGGAAAVRAPKGKAPKKGVEDAGAGPEAAGDFSVEYASSNRSSCRGCGEKIAKGEVRMAKVSVGERGYSVPLWHHAPCFQAAGLWGRPLAELPGWNSLRGQDRQALLQGLPLAPETEPQEGDAEGGAKGKGKGKGKAKGGKKGAQGDGKVGDGNVQEAAGKGKPGKRGPSPGEGDVGSEQKVGRKGKGEEEQAEQSTAASGPSKKRKGKATTPEAPREAPTDKGTPETAAHSARPVQQSRSKGRSKQEATADSGAPPSQRQGARVGEAATDAAALVVLHGGSRGGAGAAREEQMEAQSRLLWAVKDQLRACCSLADLRAVLSAGGHDTQGPETSLRDRIADSVVFGPLPPCPLCGSRLECRDGAYRCRGFLSAWSQCHYWTRQDLQRGHRAAFRLPEDASPGVLQFASWLKAQGMLDRQAPPPVRILPPEVEVTPQQSQGKAEGAAQADGEAARAAAQRRKGVQEEEKGIPAEGRGPEPSPLQGLRFVLLGKLSKSQAAWKASIAEAGGLVLPEISADVDCVVSSETSAERNLVKVQQARTLDIPLLSEAYLKACTGSGRRMPMASYALSVSTPFGPGEAPRLSQSPAKEAEGGAGARRRVKVKGRAAVHEDSGLEESCHVLDEEGVVYSTTLNRAEVALGINSFYILQVLEDDRLQQWYLYRKWGRVGNAQIGDSMVQRMDKGGAISEFQRLFFEKTGNRWDARGVPGGFQKRAGKFFPLEIDYGAGEDGERGALLHKLTGARSKLAPQLVQLLLMLFDVEAYKAAMLEFEINVAEMPLGKLTKRHVAQGFQVLTEVQDALRAPPDGVGRREGALVDASNRFFTLIPSVHPRVIRTLEDLQAQVRMLESLSEMEIASSLLSSSSSPHLSSSEDPLDECYRRLQCGLEPLAPSSDDFQLVKHYLENTHAPTHKEWGLELVDVFRVRRAPEEGAAFRGDLGNQMLLWHGSRTSNFVGILSQGLRVAPPEAPVTGYMFGKGVYFADLVSKSAQYCFAQPDAPLGLMLLSRVALGAMYELKKAQFLESLPRGKNSTKGLGKMKPEDSEARTWEGGVVVPCGKPVASGVRATDLNYNEYIVYDTSQVRLEFLLRVRFVYKR